MRGIISGQLFKMRQKDFIIRREDLKMKSEESRTKLWIDEKAKSLSYFCRNGMVVVEKPTINELKKIAESNGRVNARICLHSNPQDNLHDMIILEYQDKKCRIPHKHLEKCETLQMIEGKMMAYVFSESGDILNRVVLQADKNLMCRIASNQYHLYLPISESVIYKETKLGPFDLADNIFPRWDYVEFLKKEVNFFCLECKNDLCKLFNCPLMYKK